MISFHSKPRLAMTNRLFKIEMRYVVGTKAIAAAALDAGAVGVISGLANVFPEFMSGFYETWAKGDPKKTAEYQLKVVAARAILKYGPTLTMTHAVLRMRGMNPGFPRDPYQDIDEALYKKVEGEFKEMGLLS